MMDRRQFMLGCASVNLAAATPYLPSCAMHRLAFRALRNGSEIGTHTLEFIPRNDGIDVHVAVDFKVGFGPLTFFRYRLDGIEQWRGGVVVKADFSADNNGKADFMRCQREHGGLTVVGSKAAKYRAPDAALPSSHWNPAELDGPWINIENGELLHPQVAAKGIDTVHDANGVAIAAAHYVLSGDVRMELWYDAAKRWAALSSPADDGSVVRYERL